MGRDTTRRGSRSAARRQPACRRTRSPLSDRESRSGELGPAPPHDTGHSGPAESERVWCALPDDGGAILFHTFEDWPLHESPTDAVASAPEGWILLAGELTVDGGDVVLCAIGDCTDAVIAVGVDANAQRGPSSPLNGERFIARVRDGALADVTRVLPAGR